jgi:hypothetical protein
MLDRSQEVPGSGSPAPASTLGGPDTITAAAARTRHLRTPGDRNQTGYDFDGDGQLVLRDGWDSHHADRAFGQGPDGGSAA